MNAGRNGACMHRHQQQQQSSTVKTPLPREAIQRSEGSAPGSGSATARLHRIASHFHSCPRSSASVSFASCVAEGIMASSLQIELVPCLQDNYAYLLHDTGSGLTGIVDPSESEPVVKALKAKGFGLDFILNTHHHWDHTGANLELKKKFNAKVVGPKTDEDRIPGIDIPLSNEKWEFGNHGLEALFTPGHTRGHVCYYFEKAKAVFTGDTLFSIGCGRVFEGTMEQMWSSLSRLSSLPEDTRVFCGHEYTAANAKFAVTVEPKNAALVSHKQSVDQLRQKGQPTIPTTIGEEKSFNPFLRPFSEEIRKSIKLSESASNVDVFAAIRRAKDAF